MARGLSNGHVTDTPKGAVRQFDRLSCPWLLVFMLTRDFAYCECDRCYGRVVCMQQTIKRPVLFFLKSVCLSVLFLHYAQTAKDIDTISFEHDSPVS